MMSTIGVMTLEGQLTLDYYLQTLRIAVKVMSQVELTMVMRPEQWM
jgi:hypothetical protein